MPLVRRIFPCAALLALAACASAPLPDRASATNSRASTGRAPVSGSPAATPAVGAINDGYALIWADEFFTDGPPNPLDWTFGRGFVRNEELLWYQPENARCESSFLVITARREVVPNPRYQPGEPSRPPEGGTPNGG